MDNPHKRHLSVFTRFPEAGTTKTRMIPLLGARGAAELQRAMTEHILTRVSAAPGLTGLTVDIRFAGGDARQMETWLGPAYSYHRQGRGDLGCRMAAAFKDAFQAGADRMALVGTDIPGLSAAILEGAFAALDQADLALGPTIDGGYYLIAMHRESFEKAAGLFTGIKWGSERVLADTLKKAAAEHLRTNLLEKLADVDQPDDLRIWCAEPGSDNNLCRNNTPVTLSPDPLGTEQKI